jgi:hypothetical protein
VSLQSCLDEQLEKIITTREYHKSSILIPEIGFHVSPDRKKAIAKKLKGGGSERFMPSGFGTGYTLYGKHVRTSRFGAKVASAALKKFFDVKTLYVDKFDAD